MKKLIPALFLVSGLIFSPPGLGGGEGKDFSGEPGQEASPGDRGPPEETAFKSFYPGGQLKMSGLMREGVHHGIWTYWCEDGRKKRVEEYDEGVRHGTWIWYGPGEEEWARSVFVAGTGRDFEFHKNGRKAWEGRFKMGRKEGRWTFWDPNGRKRIEGGYRDGREEGEFIYWRSNGIKLMKGKFKDGLMEGAWTMWFGNGVKMSEENYRAGEKNGPARYWSAYDGKLTREEIYRDGRLISRKEFPEEGRAGSKSGGS